MVLLTDVTEVAPDAGIFDPPAAPAHPGRIGGGIGPSDPHAAGRRAAVRLANDASGPRNTADLERCAEKTVSSLKQLDKLVNDMLAFAHGGAAREAVSVSALLEQVAQWLRPALRDGIRLTIRTQAPDLMVRANAPSLVSAVLNLASNALQAAQRTLNLELLARRTPTGRAQIVVSDNGPGVPDKYSRTHFRAFFHDTGARQRHWTFHRQVRGRSARRQRLFGRLELRRHVRHRTTGRGD